MSRNARLRQLHEAQRQAALEFKAEQIRRSCHGLPRCPWIPRTRRRRSLAYTLLLLET